MYLGFQSRLGVGMLRLTEVYPKLHSLSPKPIMAWGYGYGFGIKVWAFGLRFRLWFNAFF